ncbi:4'-phosphopantetheinyl transferase family protein [Oceanobacillus oncorhynchi]|uniref:4'-phosphopantetheinyl transferase family protein n=1 Tax=Oceanobacillus oncorhynchi TaxID=545501 RepID=UPI001868D82F|nr:4'-phosphopantetheinyl transferase superfamily protein [Oceanobacillus oncorhynchi]
MKIYATNIKNLNELNFDYKIYNYFLSNQTLCKVASYKNYKDRVRTIISELLIQYIYIQYYQNNFNPIMIQRNKYGKPYCHNTGFQFNISHAGNWVVAIIDTNQVGIDIELMADIDYESLISMFHFIEEQQLKEATDKKEYFYKLWTIKEAVLKNIGKGMNIPLNSFYVLLNKEINSVHFKENDLNYSEFYVKTFDILENYKLSVCALHSDFPESINFLEPLQFLPYLLDS